MFPFSGKARRTFVPSSKTALIVKGHPKKEFLTASMKIGTLG
jgi:hypothetical protein